MGHSTRISGTEGLVVELDSSSVSRHRPVFLYKTLSRTTSRHRPRTCLPGPGGGSEEKGRSRCGSVMSKGPWVCQKEGSCVKGRGSGLYRLLSCPSQRATDPRTSDDPHSSSCRLGVRRESEVRGLFSGNTVIPWERSVPSGLDRQTDGCSVTPVPPVLYVVDPRRLQSLV